MAIATGEQILAADVNDALDARAKWASGTYTGDGTDNRNITTGFICIFVMIWRSSANGMWLINSASQGTYFTETPAIDLSVADAKLDAADGFEVDSANANMGGGNVYTYVAIGRGD